MRPQPECTECEKLASVSEESNKIGNFIAWMKDTLDLSICELVEQSDEWGTYEPVYLGDYGINKLLAKYFDIDLDKVDAERSELLKWLQEKYEEES